MKSSLNNCAGRSSAVQKQASNKSLMLYKKVFFFHTRRRSAYQEQAKQALAPVIIIQLAPS